MLHSQASRPRPTPLVSLVLLSVLLLHVRQSSPALCPTNNAHAHLDPMYADDHQNYLCMNYTRPTPLPCTKPPSAGWTPRWFDNVTRRPRFVIYAWWPPAPADFEPYAEAGFNLALTENFLGAVCQRKGAGAMVTHDELFDANVAASEALWRLGVLTVFNTANMCNQQLARSPTLAYGNATGGLLEGIVNATARAPGIPLPPRPQSKGETVPELRYIVAELKRRGVYERFGGIQLHDDTETQTGRTIAAAEWLHTHAPEFVPFVNQVSGNSGPQTLHRTRIFISAPEQYPIQCPRGDCRQINATAAAMALMDAYAGNAVVDARFSLHHWPLFFVGSGNGPLNGSVSPDNKTRNVRSDSLVRWSAFAAIAYGAKALNYYCWGGGIWWFDTYNMSARGRPSPMYATVREINGDAAAWGDELLAGGFEFGGALHTGFGAGGGHGGGHGGGPPTEETVVTRMSDALLCTTFIAAGDAAADGGDSPHPRADAYLFVVDKRVSGQLEPVPPRNVTLILHSSVASAVVVPHGVPGGRRFGPAFTAAGGDDGPHAQGAAPSEGVRSVRSRVWRVERSQPPVAGGHSRGALRDAHWTGCGENAADRNEASDGDGGCDREPQPNSHLAVTFELVGGGAALIRLGAAQGKLAQLLTACLAVATLTFEPSRASLAVVKAPGWAYDSWHARYRPYQGLELTAGRSFEDGEQTNFILSASMLGAPQHPSDPRIAEALAKAGFNLLTLPAPPLSALKRTRLGRDAPAASEEPMAAPASAIGAAMDNGYPFGFFVVVEPADGQAALTPEEVGVNNAAFRCHGRWAGLLVARGVCAPAPPLNCSAGRPEGRCAPGLQFQPADCGGGSSPSVSDAVAAAAALRTSGRGNWLLPFATAATPQAAISLGERGVVFAMPSVPAFDGESSPSAQGGRDAEGAHDQERRSASRALADEAAQLQLSQLSPAQAWAQAVVAQYEPLRAMLASSFVWDNASSEWHSRAPMAFVAAVDACATESDSLLRWAAFSALAYGARGLHWQGAGRCAPVGSKKFGLLASINRRIGAWGNTFVAGSAKSDFGNVAYNVTRMWSSGFPLPHAMPPGAGGEHDLVQAMDEDLLVVQLGSMGAYATPMIYVVDQRVDAQPGVAVVRTLRISLREDVAATQPIEGDCAASRCQCGMSLLGSQLNLRLPGGAGQLVALALHP